MTRTLGAWDCPYCSEKRIFGNVFDCPECGHPRPRGIRFYQISDAPVVTPEIAEQLGSGGPNWYCEHCDSGNKDNNTTCWKCGAPRGSSPSHEIKYYKQGESPHTAKDADAMDDDDQSWTGVDVSQNDKSGSQSNIWQGSKSAFSTIVNNGFFGIDFNKIKQYILWGGGLALVAVLAIFIYQFFFSTHIESISIYEYSWSQNVALQEFQVIHDSSWTTYPSDAYNISEDYRDTGADEKVHDGWTIETYSDTCYRTESYMDTCTRSVYDSRTCTGSRDNGDGSFDTYSYDCGSYTTESYSCSQTREVPYSCTKTRDVELYHYEDVYDWYYTYDINRWKTIDNYPTNGYDHKPYFYTDFQLKNPYSTGAPELGQQQKLEQTGEYNITFFCNNKRVGEEGYFTKDYDLETWTQFDQNISYKIEINYFGWILSDPIPGG